MSSLLSPVAAAVPVALSWRRRVRRVWRRGRALLWDRRVLALAALGFSAGLPLLLIFSSLSLWLGEAGVERRAVTFFSWAALAYSFKFVWAPLVDRVPLPVLTACLGRRRSWLLLAQLGVIAAILGMAATDPAAGPAALVRMAAFAVLLGFMSATQDIVIDAYRIEVAGVRRQGVLSSAYVAGYRVGMVVAGAGVLFLASAWGSAKGQYVYGAWAAAYGCAALAMGVGVATTLLVREPAVDVGVAARPAGEHARLLAVFAAAVAAFIAVFWGWDAAWALPPPGPLAALVWETLRLLLALAAAAAVGTVLVRLGVARADAARATWVEPVRAFFARHGWADAALLLAIVGLYRISDIVLGVISNMFYQDVGFSKAEIATAVKTFGVVVSIAGGFVGGLLAAGLGVLRALWWGALLSALTNLAFVGLALVGPQRALLYAVVTADNLAAGLASAAFVAFLSSLTQVRFTAAQYAIFSSLMTLLPKTLGGYAGTLVDALGYPGFFVLTTLLGLPVLGLVSWAGRRLPLPGATRAPVADAAARAGARSG